MMFTTRMVQLFGVALKRDGEVVTEVLLREGVMQLVNVSEVEQGEEGGLSTAKPQGTAADITDLRKRIEGFLHVGRVVPSMPTQDHLIKREPIDLAKERDRLDKVTGQCESIRERQRTVQQEILKLQDIQRQIQLYGIGISDVTLAGKHSFISMQIGKVAKAKLKQFEQDLRSLPSLSVKIGEDKDNSHQLLIAMKRDKGQIETILNGVGWTEIELPSELQSIKKDVAVELGTKLEKLLDEQKQLEESIREVVHGEEERLKEVWANLRVNELICKVQTYFKNSSRTVIFTGWLPASKRERLTRGITEATDGRCYLEWRQATSRDAELHDVPVQLANHPVLAPFQMLVSNFGIPKYGTIDPTPFVMPLYLAMFGLMFADVGQGLILVALGILGVMGFKGKRGKDGLLQLSWLIIWCGSSSALFGALFGSYFGLPWIKPLWFDYHGIIAGHSSNNSTITSVYDILKITIYFGISVILLGLVFNWINIIRSRKWSELVFDKGGVLGAWIYVGGIYIARYMVSHDYKGVPSGNLVFVLVGLPALLLFIKEPYHIWFSHGHAHGELDKGNPVFVFLKMVMEWVVELLEIFSGYLSNTLSFMRVAGLGIAHVCLMISFFTLAGMTSGIFSIIILVIGNVLVIGLEGLSAGIQALRLNYYEFFTKFFHGTGKLYSPISLGTEP